MGPLTSSVTTSTGNVTTVPARLFGLIVSVSAAHADTLLTLKDGSGGDTRMIVSPGDAALGPVVIMFPAESYIKFHTQIHATHASTVDHVTYLYQT